MAFVKATKSNATIKMALTGPSGSGKTYSALLLAKGLGGRTALLDTEYGSASLYSDIFDFDTWDEEDPSGFPPEYFIRVIKEAEAAGYNNLIIDSLTHEWNGRGGVLELLDSLTRTKYKGNSFIAWSELTPRHTKLIETIVGSKMNIIATMRSKTEYVLNKDEKSGKQLPQKVGVGTIQRDGVDYEFTIMFELDRDTHIAFAGKDRTTLFTDPVKITEETGVKIRNWLRSETASKVTDVKPKAQKLDPVEYIKNDMDVKFASGKTLSDVLAHYECLLREEFHGDSPLNLPKEKAKALATALYKENKAKGE